MKPLCCLSDVIFFIYLYQRWIYRMDPSRMNEFGVSQDMIDEHEQKKTDGDDASPSEPAIDEDGTSKSNASKEDDESGRFVRQRKKAEN